MKSSDTVYREVLESFKDVKKVRVEAEVLPRRGHEGPEEEQMYSSTISSTSALDGGWVVNATSLPLYPPRERLTVLTVQGAVRKRKYY
jgi:hypothetical protein